MSGLPAKRNHDATGLKCGILKLKITKFTHLLNAGTSENKQMEEPADQNDDEHESEPIDGDFHGLSDVSSIRQWSPTSLQMEDSGIIDAGHAGHAEDNIAPKQDDSTRGSESDLSSSAHEETLAGDGDSDVAQIQAEFKTAISLMKTTMRSLINIQQYYAKMEQNRDHDVETLRAELEASRRAHEADQALLREQHTSEIRDIRQQYETERAQLTRLHKEENARQEKRIRIVKRMIQQFRDEDNVESDAEAQATPAQSEYIKSETPSDSTTGTPKPVTPCQPFSFIAKAPVSKPTEAAKQTMPSKSPNSTKK